TDQITRVTGMKRHADLALRPEAADARPVSRPRIDDHKRTLLQIQLNTLGRPDAHESVIHRSLELAPIHDHLEIERKHVRHRAGSMLTILVSALAQDVQKQNRPLEGVGQILDSRIGRCRKRIRITGHRTFLWLATSSTSMTDLWFSERAPIRRLGTIGAHWQL